MRQCALIQVTCLKLDLASMSSVKAFSKRVADLPQLDVLVCNAGLMCPVKHTLTQDGMEVQFQVQRSLGICMPNHVQ